MPEQYYIKKDGKYIPSNDPYALDGLEEGSWMVVVKKNSTSIKSIKKPIKSKLIELDSALHYLSEGLIESMHEASKMRPRATLLSKKEQKAWEAYKKIMGKDMPTYFYYDSLHDIADRGCKYLRKVILENNCDVNKIKEKYEIKKREVNNSIEELEV